MIRLARDAARLRAVDRARACRALGWLIASRAMLRLMPYPRARAALERLPARAAPRRSMTAADAQRAIARAARVMPGASCLDRAFAAAALLRREGLPSTLTIEVALADAQTLRAHAVLDASGVTVTGDGARLDAAAEICRDEIAAAP